MVFSQYYFLDKENKIFDHGKLTKKKFLPYCIFFSGKVYITALPPIPTENLTLNDIDDLIERTRSTMTATFYEANKEIKESLRSF